MKTSIEGKKKEALIVVKVQVSCVRVRVYELSIFDEIIQGSREQSEWSFCM